jgi:Photosynthesis system II assembly factor YCF48
MAGRDQEKLATNLLRQSLGAPGEACPDPGIWAAYFEQSLDREETARAQLHLSQCSICRERLAAMYRLSEPAAAHTMRLPKSSWMWDWRWLAPAAAALLVAAIWIVRRPIAKPGREQQPLLAMSQSQALPSAAAPPEHGRNESPAASSAGKSGQQASQSFWVTDKLSPGNQQLQVHNNRSDLAQNSRNKVGWNDSAKKNQEPSSPSAGSQRAEVDTAVGNELKPSHPAASPAPAPLPSGVAGSGSTAETVTVEGVLNSSGPQSAATEMKSNQSPSAAPLSAERLPLTAQARSRALGIPAAEQRSSMRVITTPDPQVLWRIAEGGFVERSTDGGTSWKGELPDVSAQLTTGFAPSADVCWVVGRSGAIFLTTNASDWKRIPPPAKADFTAITALDASSAIVTTADGRKFATTDGGSHWNPAP